MLPFSTYIGQPLTYAVTPSTSRQHVEQRDASVDGRERAKGRDRTGGEALRQTPWGETEEENNHPQSKNA